jgi:hypothetical protein
VLLLGVMIGNTNAHLSTGIDIIFWHLLLENETRSNKFSWPSLQDYPQDHELNHLLCGDRMIQVVTHLKSNIGSNTVEKHPVNNILIICRDDTDDSKAG